MFRSLPLPMAATVLLALMAASAGAGGIPIAANCTVPSHIVLVGSSGGVPDAAAGQFTVVVRDIANNPRSGYSVVIDLSACADLEICADQMDPNAQVSCTAKTVRKYTNALGEVTFTVMGRSNGGGNASTLANGGRIFSNGALIGTPSVSSFDLDGSGGVGAGDLSVWFGDFGNGQPFERSDFDGSGTIGAADLSAWLGVFGAGGSAQSCGASCP